MAVVDRATRGLELGNLMERVEELERLLDQGEKMLIRPNSKPQMFRRRAMLA